ncbi:hypothetical protein Agub_g11189 [Astrephomene gubernaculifera]|uniref:Uncharacterized protein n=1 Tax=Astrephomene gubernaculifera TaxID=47775 RepID=A0AAD3DYK1_9CHLO|nr:hypothetical protein Agub_g11189 [Astrephomene gubernaculifera]
MPPLSKKALKELKAREACPVDQTDCLGCNGSGIGTGGGLTEDISDEDCFSQASVGCSSHSDRDVGSELRAVHNMVVEMLGLDDNKRAGPEKVECARRRLREAIDAEHNYELQQQCRRLCGDRESLQEKNIVIFGISIQAHEWLDCFTLRRQDSGSFEEKFGLRTRITIFQDVGEPTPKKPKDGSPTAAPAPTAFQPRSDPAVGGNRGATVKGGKREEEEDEEEDELSRGGAVAPNSAKANKAASNALQDNVRSRLLEIGIIKAFDGVVVKTVSPKEIVIKTRDESAGRKVDDANEGPVRDDDDDESDSDNGSCVASPKKLARWAIAGDLQDVTYRRQAAAAESLGTFFSKKDISPATGRAVRRDEEVRLRKVILSDPERSEDQLFARSAAAQGVEWLGEEFQAELHGVLASPRLGLNGEQLSVLKQAAGRSLTLMQGPPGTGKTYALAAMAAALCQVFHDPNGTGDWDCGDREFELPSTKSMEDWNQEEVTRWINSFRDPELVARALEGMRGHTGRAVVDHKTKRLRHLLTRSSSSSSSCSSYDDDDSPEELERAKRYAEDFKRLRDAALQLIFQCQQKGGRWTTGFWRTADRDMRIIMCADTNTAANRLLEQLVGLLPPESSYSIVRMGVMDELADGDGSESHLAAKKYHIDSRRRNHPLEQASQRIYSAIKEHKFSNKLAAELTDDILAFAERKRIEADKQSHRVLVQKCWKELATKVKTDISPRAESLIRQRLRAKTRMEREDAEKDLMKFVKELREIALHDILIAVQVVVGTNTSIGEARDICKKNNLSFPIVLMDEAGQSSEPSSNISLTLGAEWVLMGGDLEQLPPTLNTDVARKVLGFYTETAASQYGRFASLDVLELSLSRQYRMHPAIRDFPSRCFYDNKLFEDPQRPPDMRVPQPRLHGCNFKWPSEKQGRGEYPLAFFDVPYGVEQQENMSYFNEEEASLAMQLMMAFACDPTVQSIIIITPYKMQATYINKRLDAARGFLSLLRKQGKFHASTVKAATVDGFQGHEADVVIITTVRNNGAGWLGHVADERRLNVAVTRARRALLLVGSIRTLKSALAGCAGKGGPRYANYWPRLIEHIRSRGDAVVEGPATNEYISLMAALPTAMACTHLDFKKMELIASAGTLLQLIEPSLDRQLLNRGRSKRAPGKARKAPKRGGAAAVQPPSQQV